MTPKLLTLATLLLGAVTAWVAARSAPAFTAILKPVQLAMSVLVPFVGVLEVTGLHRSGTDRRVAPRLLAAIGLAAGSALAGTLLAALATVLAGGTWPPAPRTARLVTAAVLVQLVAQLFGIACGLLLRRPLVAMAATIVVPMTVTAVLTVVAPGGAPVRWLTPYGNAQSLLTDTPTVTTYAALGVVVLLWCLIPNAILLPRHRQQSRRRPCRSSTSRSAATGAAHPEWSGGEIRDAAAELVLPPHVAGHVAGAAVDLTLAEGDGAELAMDGQADGRTHRALLSSALRAAGFVSDPARWWHWSYGDRYWTFVTGHTSARYGPVGE